ncbi:hypothetical protein T03_14618 [Trichinella britovi]|uniref:Uncharacterized protein n=1 Tax=Trichinella britovi TaxID=45882 RepID=A0A0V1CDL9_TRIBR|nr:hypothetical protein T03_14618 [Trichinella britovi]
MLATQLCQLAVHCIIIDIQARSSDRLTAKPKRQDKLDSNEMISHNVKIVDSSAILKLHSDHSIALASSSSSSTMTTGCYTIKSASSKPSFGIDLGYPPLFLPGSVLFSTVRTLAHTPPNKPYRKRTQARIRTQADHLHCQIRLKQTRVSLYAFMGSSFPDSFHKNLQTSLSAS